jgi:hypothetical protein
MEGGDPSCTVNRCFDLIHEGKSRLCVLRLCTALQELWLSDNQLAGAIPEALGAHASSCLAEALPPQLDRE